MNTTKRTQIIGLTLLFLMISIVSVWVLLQKTDSKSGNFIAYSKMEDKHKLYIKNKETNEERVLVDKGVINVCSEGEWVYYIPGDFEGIFKIKVDGTENSKMSSLEPIYPVGGSVKIESKIGNGSILYRLITLGQIGGKEPVPKLPPDRFYQLNLQDNTITKITKP